jgi:hypothetical protein
MSALPKALDNFSTLLLTSRFVLYIGFLINMQHGLAGGFIR